MASEKLTRSALQDVKNINKEQIMTRSKTIKLLSIDHDHVLNDDKENIGTNKSKQDETSNSTINKKLKKVSVFVPFIDATNKQDLKRTRNQHHEVKNEGVLNFRIYTPNEELKKITGPLSPIKQERLFADDYLVNNLRVPRNKTSLTNRFKKKKENLGLSEIINLHIEDGDKREIFKYLKHCQTRHLITKSNPFTCYNNEQRPILVEWLNKLNDIFQLDAPTLFTTVRVFDLIISETCIANNMLQTVGMAVFIMFAKYYHGDLPYSYLFQNCQLDIVAIRRNYMKTLIRLQEKVFKFLGMQLNVQEPVWFLGYIYSKMKNNAAHKTNDCFLHGALYILELFTLHDAFSQTIAFHQALSAFSYSVEIINEDRSIWSRIIKFVDANDYTNFENIKIVMRNQLIKAQNSNYRYDYVNDKYASEINFEVAKIFKKYIVKEKWALESSYC